MREIDGRRTGDNFDITNSSVVGNLPRGLKDVRCHKALVHGDWVGLPIVKEGSVGRPESELQAEAQKNPWWRVEKLHFFSPYTEGHATKCHGTASLTSRNPIDQFGEHKFH